MVLCVYGIVLRCYNKEMNRQDQENDKLGEVICYYIVFCNGEKNRES